MMRRLTAIGQQLALMLLVITAPTTFRHVLWEYPLPPELIFVEFRGIVLFVMDVALGLLLIVSITRALLDAPWRSRLKHVITQVMVYRGGVLWLIVVAWMLVGLTWSIAPEVGIYQIIRLLSGLFVALVVATTVINGQQTLLMLAWVAGAGVQALVGIRQRLFPEWPSLAFLGELNFLDLETARGLTVNPNNLAGYLLIALFLLLYLIYQHRKTNPYWHGFSLAVGLLIGAGLLATESLSALAALVITGIVGLIMLAYRTRMIQRQRDMLIIIGVLISGGLVGSVLLLQSESADTIQQRLTYGYPDTLDVVRLAPLTGAGTGGGMVQIGEYWRYVEFQLQVQVRLPAHNAFLMEAADTGLIGMGLFALAWAVTLWQGMRLRHPGSLILALAFFSVTLVSLFDYYFRGDVRSQMLFFVLVGLLWGEMVRQQVSTASDDNGTVSA